MRQATSQTGYGQNANPVRCNPGERTRKKVTQKYLKKTKQQNI